MYHHDAVFACTAIVPTITRMRRLPPLREYTPVLMALKHLANGALPESLGVQLRNLPYILGVSGITHGSHGSHGSRSL